MKITDTVERFAKVFDVGPRQVLAYIEFDDEHDDLYVMHQIFPGTGTMIDLAVRAPERVIRKAFDMYDQQTAENLMQLDIVKRALALHAKDDTP